MLANFLESRVRQHDRATFAPDWMLPPPPRIIKKYLLGEGSFIVTDRRYKGPRLLMVPE